MLCHYFDAGRCRSCTQLPLPYEEQLAGKEKHCRALVGDHADLQWLPSVASPEAGFRNKAKMVVTGTADDPVIGILDAGGLGVDLRDCGLHTSGLRASLPVLAAFVSRAGLAPYDLATRRGELKHLLVTESPDGELMVRFVLRSQEPVARIRKHLPSLLTDLPALRVASVNLLPEHKAVLEGDREIPLTGQTALRMRLNGIDLFLRPRSFFQTNTTVAATVYRQTREWVDELAPSAVWDLYCGVGGFALHCADPSREVVGVEASAEAIASAELSSARAGLPRVRFVAGDATDFALTAPEPPELVIVNPPRRGIGPVLAAWLEASSVRHVVYSSCNAESLVRDLAAMPSLAPVRGRLLDMFPQTTHYEVVMLLRRRSAAVDDPQVMDAR